MIEAALREPSEELDRLAQRLGRRQLRADVASDRVELEVWALQDPRHDRLGHGYGQAELRLAKPRRDVRVRLCVDVGIHPEPDRKRPTELERDAFHHVELLNVFDVKAPDAGLRGRNDFFATLADAAVHDVLGRDPGDQGPLERHSAQNRYHCRC